MRESQEATQTQSKSNYLPALQADSLLRSRREVTWTRTKAILPSTMMEQKDGKIEDHGSLAHFPISFFWFLRGIPRPFHMLLVRLTVVVPCQLPLGGLVSQADQSEYTFNQPVFGAGMGELSPQSISWEWYVVIVGIVKIRGCEPGNPGNIGKALTYAWSQDGTN